MALLYLLIAALIVLALLPQPWFWFGTVFVFPVIILCVLFYIGVFLAAKEVLAKKTVALLSLGGLLAIPVVLRAGMYIHLGDSADMNLTEEDWIVTMYVTRLILAAVMLMFSWAIGNLVANRCKTIRDVRLYGAGLALMGIISQAAIGVYQFFL
ncbi:MAG TPA: hypothetical protein VLA04_03715 [Verrucomicrobiae bacterium]|nr:hypothetical protein [Verrucomicrobiae bacterium]